MMVEVTKPRNLGRFARVRHVASGRTVVGNVIDVDGEGRPKRLRIQVGSRDLQGTVMQPHEYEFVEWEGLPG